ncbi:class I adenylate-forming enzyme family protein [Phenylobacterium sp.]|jgi:long-chain acyl-CoA synthetase|uniref:class I adenylate-forming enzyme family protein n=1 Tax=Phenylobacterium sp. TaxID=1871053 RepID=UPI002F92FA50
MGTSRSEAVARLTTAGEPLEIGVEPVGGVPTRVFRRAPPTLLALADRAVEFFGELPFLVFDQERLTFREVGETAARLASGLRDLAGVGPGDRVAIAMRNYPEWVTAFIAIQNLGAVAVAMNAWWTPRELALALADAEPKVIFVDAERLERLPCEADMGGLVAVAVRTDAGRRRDVVRYDSLLTSSLTDPFSAASPDDEALIIYTSGSTAAPKGAVSTHRNMIQALFSWRLDAAADAVAAGRPPPDETRDPPTALLLPVPLFHVSGSHVGLLTSLLTGRKLVLMHKWDPEAALDLIERETVTHFTGPSAVTGDLVLTARRAGRRLDSLLSVGGGGAPRPPEQVRAIPDAIPTAEANIGWGMTETNAIGTGHSGAAYQAHPTSSGLPSAILDFRVVTELGVELPEGEAGELQVRGATVIRRYWRKPAETAASFHDGWFRTGDLARLEGGRLYILDRLKDMVLRGGENISCPQVEAELAEHPCVAEAAVFGVPHERLGEQLAAVVTTRPGARGTEMELRHFLGQRLAAFQVPHAIKLVTEPLPRTASGKIAKRLLRDAWVAGMATGAPNSASGTAPQMASRTR